MNTASRWLLVLGLVNTTFSVVAPVHGVKAQDVQITGPLAGAPAVRKMRVFREGRLQLQPAIGVTLQDEFTRTVFAGVQAGYHITDWLGIAAFFDYGALAFDTSLTDQVTKHGQTSQRNRLSLPNAAKFKDQIGRINFLAGGQATFIPLRGKLALFQALFVDTDFYLFAGAAAAQVEERKDVKGAEAIACILGTEDANQRATCEGTQTRRQTRIAIAPTFGAGLSLYLTNYMALTLEYRAFPFWWNTSGTDEGGLNDKRKSDKNGEFPDKEITSADRTFQFNQMFSLGVAFYLPFQGEVTQ